MDYELSLRPINTKVKHVQNNAIGSQNAKFTKKFWKSMNHLFSAPMRDDV